MTLHGKETDNSRQVERVNSLDTCIYIAQYHSKSRQSGILGYIIPICLHNIYFIAQAIIKSMMFAVAHYKNANLKCAALFISLRHYIIYSSEKNYKINTVSNIIVLNLQVHVI